MLDIRINNESLNLSGKEKISFTEKNNLFDTALIQMGYSMPFTIPAEKNMRILGFINDPNSLTDFSKEYPVDIYLSGLPFRKGSLFVSSATSKSISCKLVFGNIPLAQRLSNKLLSELDMGQIQLPKLQRYFLKRQKLLDQRANHESDARLHLAAQAPKAGSIQIPVFSGK